MVYGEEWFEGGPRVTKRTSCQPLPTGRTPGNGTGPLHFNAVHLTRVAVPSTTTGQGGCMCSVHTHDIACDACKAC